jgi:CRISPR type IV-associated protein Csf1
MTASELFATQRNEGIYHCYYCGAFCTDDHKKSDYVKDTFTNRDIVKFPGSEFVCSGCVESLGRGPDEMVMIDGSVKVRTNERGMQPRMYSWVLTEYKKIAATKAHIKELREIILNPPKPPFSIILADSGQKQLIFRAPVAMSRDYFPVMLEDGIIYIKPKELQQRIILASMVCSATGKPALMDCEKISTFIAVEKYYGYTDPLEKWIEVYKNKLSKLAAWLCPAKKECQDEYPQCGAIPAEVGRTGRPGKEIAGDGNDGDQGRGDQISLDFT